MMEAGSGRVEFPLLMAQDICKVYKMGDSQVHALRSATMMVKPGEFLAIMGTSGSGKSTLLQILGCLDRPSSGSVFLEGQDVANLPDLELARTRNRKLGFIFQAFNLMAQETATANVEIPLQYAGIARKERRRLSIEALTAVGLADRVDHRPAELSGGQRQRVAIARAIVNKPLVILADEPTGALDSRSGVEVMAILQQLNEQGRTIVIVTHDLNIAYHAHRIIKIADGMVVGDEVVEEQKQARSYLEEILASQKEQRPDIADVAGSGPLAVESAQMVSEPPAESFEPVRVEETETVVCPKCSTGNRKRSRYCRECGFPLRQTNLGIQNVKARIVGDRVRCDGCGAQNRSIAKFCVSCGALMDRSYSGI
jgi:putative ABC transport system ATP-binding protein